MSSISYSLIQHIDENQALMLQSLYENANWWDPTWNREWLKEIVEHSTLFIIAQKEDVIIGMGRMIADGLSDGYIQDVTVLPFYRGMGIGAQIVSQLVEAAQAKSIDWIGLIGAPKTESFYTRLGFEVMPEHIPFHFKGKPE